MFLSLFFNDIYAVKEDRYGDRKIWQYWGECGNGTRENSLRNLAKQIFLEERSWQHVIPDWKIKSEININLMNLWGIHKSLLIF